MTVRFALAVGDASSRIERLRNVRRQEGPDEHARCAGRRRLPNERELVEGSDHDDCCRRAGGAQSCDESWGSLGRQAAVDYDGIGRAFEREQKSAFGVGRLGDDQVTGALGHQAEGGSRVGRVVYDYDFDGVSTAFASS
jgi:hypothetical protein